MTTEHCLSIFHKRICNVCRGCKRSVITDPEFCFTLAVGNEISFVNILKAIFIIRNRIASFNKIDNFQDFCAIICKYCVFKSDGCDELDIRIECYEKFIEQTIGRLKGKEKAQIWRTFSGITLDVIESKYDAVLKANLNRKSTRKLRKLKNTLIQIINTPNNKYENKKSKKEKSKDKQITSLLFYNEDNPEWQERIYNILGIANDKSQKEKEDETDHRLVANASEHTK